MIPKPTAPHLLAQALLIMTAVAGCASEPPVCERASAVISECGIPVETDPFQVCDTAEVEESAESLVALYDKGGCSHIDAVAEKSDGCLLCRDHEVSELKAFRSDGCSMFPDGTASDPEAWQQCCVNHDYAYYIGGPAELRSEADRALAECVTNMCSETLGDLMWLGVRAGGSPALFTPWRWGYGWNFDPFNGYRVLPEDQESAALANVEAHRANPTPVEAFEQSFRRLVEPETSDAVDEFNELNFCDSE